MMPPTCLQHQVSTAYLQSPHPGSGRWDVNFSMAVICLRPVVLSGSLSKGNSQPI